MDLLNILTFSHKRLDRLSSEMFYLVENSVVFKFILLKYLIYREKKTL